MNDRPAIHMHPVPQPALADMDVLSPAERRLMHQWRNSIDRGDWCRACGKFWGPHQSDGWVLHHSPSCRLIAFEGQADLEAAAKDAITEQLWGAK